MLCKQAMQHVLHELFGLSKDSSLTQQLFSEGIIFLSDLLCCPMYFDFQNYEFELYSIHILHAFFDIEGWKSRHEREQQVLTIDRYEWWTYCQDYLIEQKENKLPYWTHYLFAHCLPSFGNKFTMKLKCRYAMCNLMTSNKVLSPDVNGSPLLENETDLNVSNDLLDDLALHCKHLRDILLSVCDAISVENLIFLIQMILHPPGLCQRCSMKVFGTFKTILSLLLYLLIVIVLLTNSRFLARSPISLQ
jgi:hypothetical protein